MGLADDPGFIF